MLDETVPKGVCLCVHVCTCICMCMCVYMYVSACLGMCACVFIWEGSVYGSVNSVINSRMFCIQELCLETLKLYSKLLRIKLEHAVLFIGTMHF